jgi:hypothetical protein
MTLSTDSASIRNEYQESSWIQRTSGRLHVQQPYKLPGPVTGIPFLPLLLSMNISTYLKLQNPVYKVRQAIMRHPLPIIFILLNKIYTEINLRGFDKPLL